MEIKEDPLTLKNLEVAISSTDGFTCSVGCLGRGTSLGYWEQDVHIVKKAQCLWVWSARSRAITKCRRVNCSVNSHILVRVQGRKELDIAQRPELIVFWK